MDSNAPPAATRGGLLDLIERLGNRLPDPATLFILGTLLVMGLSEVAVRGGWQVTQKLPQPVTQTVVEDGVERRVPVLDADGDVTVEWRVVNKTDRVFRTVEVTDEATGVVTTEVAVDDAGEPIVDLVETDQPDVLKARSLLRRDGLFWAIKSMVDNFMAFPPLGVVLVGMLGIGVAERTGLIGALLKAFMLVVPGMLLTPAMIFIGIMSSMAMDAGYVVLPPLAAALYKAGVFAVWANNDPKVLQFLPPLVLSDAEADELIERVRAALQ